MTVQEFSNEFDVLLNSFATATSFEFTTDISSLDEYEKSVFLTEAQEQIVKELYNGTFTGESLEKTEELRRGLNSLIKTANLTQTTGVSIGSTSYFFELSDDVWFIIYESVELKDGPICKDNKILRVVPMRHDEWHKIKDNPFKGPNERQAIRLDSSEHTVEIVSRFPIQKYLIRYLSKPTPIILTPLEGEVAIEGLQTITECKLNSALHRVILERAVQLAMRRFPQLASK